MSPLARSSAPAEDETLLDLQDMGEEDTRALTGRVHDLNGRSKSACDSENRTVWPSTSRDFSEPTHVQVSFSAESPQAQVDAATRPSGLRLKSYRQRAHNPRAAQAQLARGPVKSSNPPAADGASGKASFFARLRADEEGLLLVNLGLWLLFFAAAAVQTQNPWALFAAWCPLSCSIAPILVRDHRRLAPYHSERPRAGEGSDVYLAVLRQTRLSPTPPTVANDQTRADKPPRALSADRNDTMGEVR